MESRDFKPVELITSALDELKNKSTVSIDCEPGRYNSLELCYFTVENGILRQEHDRTLNSGSSDCHHRTDGIKIGSTDRPSVTTV
jgi:hypothetical protein